MAHVCELRSMSVASTSLMRPTPAVPRCLARCGGNQQLAAAAAAGPRHVAGRTPRHQRVQTAAYAGSFGSIPPSVDPMAGALDTGVYTRGQLMTVHSQDQLDSVLQEHADQLTLLMCKSQSCRPCKMFKRKYMRLAEQFPEAVCLDIFGDETPETRKMMITWQVRVTPTFRLYRGSQLVDTLTGTNEKKLARALLAHLYPDELATHDPAEIAEIMEDAAEQVQQQQQVVMVPGGPASASQVAAATLS